VAITLAQAQTPVEVEVEVEVEVAVLGPVEVRGAAQAFGRAAALDLVVYLALHPGGAGHDVWGSALWTDRSISMATLHSTASVARRALGRSSQGIEHLPRGGGRLRLSPTVGSDVERFARHANSPDPAEWPEALRLIRGRPLDGLRLGDWAVLDGTQAALESMVVDTALKGATDALQGGQAEAAEWMVRQGLRASPYDERLYRALLRITEAKGDRIGLHAVMTELLRKAVDASSPLPGSEPHPGAASPVALVHPRTVDLYQRLIHGEEPAAGEALVRL
jgi:DNA-binding SARP family transcriptional activator